MNILVIDDDKDFLFLISRSIRKEGHHVHISTTGLEALQWMAEHPTDVVISDVVMRDTPIMSLTCALKNRYPKTPIILISGLPEGPLVSTTLTLGADEFVPKPINMPQLLTAINRYGAKA